MINIVHLRGEISRWLQFSLCSAATLAMCACASVPDHMEVREGISPSNVNEDVRFRTTYYFRVFDSCRGAYGSTTSQPVTDSLFRFVMTGKANARSSKIQFESGTLRASQIDPFGATVEQDEDGRLRFVSEAEVQAKAQASNAIRDVQSLIDLKKNLIELNALNKNGTGSGDTGNKSVPDLVNTTTLNALDTQINALIGGQLGVRADQSSLADSVGDPVTALNCPAGSKGQRGFQVMGPQGVKTFNQDERLLMAMSTSAKPLIAALSEVSGRYLTAKEEQQSVSDILLPLVREQLIVSQLTRAEFQHGSADEVAKLIEDTKAILAAPETTP